MGKDMRDEAWKTILTSWVLDVDGESQGLDAADQAIARCASGIYRETLHGYRGGETWGTDENVVRAMLHQAAGYTEAVAIRRRDEPEDASRIANAARGPVS
jgi:hypothetical protein